MYHRKDVIALAQRNAKTSARVQVQVVAREATIQVGTAGNAPCALGRMLASHAISTAFPEDRAFNDARNSAELCAMAGTGRVRRREPGLTCPLPDAWQRAAASPLMYKP